MKHLARSVLDLYYELTFVEEDYVEFEWSLRRCAEMRMAIEQDYTLEERTALSEAAAAKLRELDDAGRGGAIPPTVEQRSFLEAVAAGRFDGAPPDR